MTDEFKNIINWEGFSSDVEILTVNVAIPLMAFYRKLIAEGAPEDVAKELVIELANAIFTPVFSREERR